MSSKPLISSIIIFFNAEKFFEEAIESVLSQTYDNWELLLADDGSTDGSTAIALKYAQQYPEKVRYLEHEGHQNRGMSATRNLGIRHAKGEYIAFLDADDVWLSHKLKQQVEVMQLYPEAGMVYGKSLYWQSWTGNSEDSGQDYVPDAYVEAGRLYYPTDLLTLSYPLGRATPPPPTDIMLRRDAIEYLGGFEEGFQKIYQLYEDQAFFTKLYLYFPVFVADECWDKYRLHPDSCGSVVNKAGQYHQVRSYFLNWLEDYFKKQGITDSYTWDALRKALFPYRYPVLFKLRNLPSRARGAIKKLSKLITQ
jgi:glycosyltransferase involved in cell wall biosynthesis